ncbi:hypothetical protein [Pseudonocardia halophobica]|nr:hypothetical protein [Pseudonocardia halophobica]
MTDRFTPRRPDPLHEHARAPQDHRIFRGRHLATSIPGIRPEGIEQGKAIERIVHEFGPVRIIIADAA